MKGKEIILRCISVFLSVLLLVSSVHIDGMYSYATEIQNEVTQENSEQEVSDDTESEDDTNIDIQDEKEDIIRPGVCPGGPPCAGRRGLRRHGAEPAGKLAG